MRGTCRYPATYASWGSAPHLAQPLCDRERMHGMPRFHVRPGQIEGEKAHPMCAKDTSKRKRDIGDARRTVNVHLRVTPAEKTWLKTHADEEGLSLTGYVIARTVHGEALSGLASVTTIGDISRELSTQGRNLNQLTAALNRMKQATEGGASARDVEEFVAGIRAQADETWPKLMSALGQCLDVLQACQARR